MGVFYSRYIDYDNILTDVHEEMKAKFKMKDNSAKAQKIEEILREIKHYSIKLQKNEDENPKDPVFAELNNQYKDLVSIATELLGDYRNYKGMSKGQLFQRSHKNFEYKKGFSDDIFEEELASVFGAIEFLGGNKKAEAKIHLFGTDNVTSDTLDLAIERDYEKYLEKTFSKIAEKQGKKYNAKELHVKAGKPDVHGVTLEISQPVPNRVAELAALTKGANFSVKNYSTFKEVVGEVRDESGKILEKGTVIHRSLSDIGLHFGNTNLFKSVIGGFSEADGNLKDQLAFFYRGLNHLKWNKKGIAGDVEEHWTHLRIIYELIGSGMKFLEGGNAQANYIIWNDPASELIAVRDVSSLLYNILFGAVNARGGMWSNITIAGNKF